MSYNQNNGFKKDYGPRVNEYIRVPKVQLINEQGVNEGEVDTNTARLKAQEAGLDLVEVGPNVQPPVCKIMNFSKYLYEQNKKKRSNKSGKLKEQKELRFTPVMDIGDTNYRIKRALEFLEKGHPVKVTMVRKGRQSMELAQSNFAEILTNFTDYSSIETEPKREGDRISITFKKNVKTKNK
ncbi:MAG: translation initiation factor IF-3 [Candidatus Dojkabacteria bacterium]|nr:translation initiation factor IF-3 [Candidatus Dojkabacteria bacterium]